jgi:hypothetical protein
MDESKQSADDHVWQSRPLAVVQAEAETYR